MRCEKILLTGGGGLVGRALTPLLAARGFEIHHFDVADPGDGHPCVVGDLRDATKVREACEGMDAVIHVAALHGASWSAAGDDVGFEVNVVGTKNVLEAARCEGVRRVVFTSSIWATGHGPHPPYLPIDEELPRQPAEMYGLTKLLGESMCAYVSSVSDLSTVVLRPGGIRPAQAYGPGQTAYLGACVDVRDVASAHVLALDAPPEFRHGVFVITAESPLCGVAPEEYRADPAAALEKVLPGAAACVARGDFALSPHLEWYTVEKAKRFLGYRSRFPFTLEGSSGPGRPSGKGGD